MAIKKAKTEIVLDKILPKRIVCITQLEDNTYSITYVGCRSYSDVRRLCSMAERDAIKKKHRGVPLCPKDSAPEGTTPLNVQGGKDAS